MINRILSFILICFSLVGSIIPFILESFYLLNRKIFGINIEEEIRKFPVFDYSESDYRLLRNRVKTFISQVDRGERASLLINSGDINLVAVHHVINSMGLRTEYPNYYEIQDGKILEHKLVYPAVLTKYGFIRATWSFCFESQESIIVQKWEYISSTLPAVTFVEPFPIEKSNFLYHLLFPLHLSADLEHFKEITSRIKNISIITDQLVIEA
jgi:hypothetical protein